MTYLPQCGRHTYADFNPQAAKKFDLTDSEYYQVWGGRARRRQRASATRFTRAPPCRAPPDDRA